MRASSRGSLVASLLLVLGASVTAAFAQTYEVYHSFVDPAGSPHGPVVKAPDGTLYGTTEMGGAYRRGSVYSLTPGALGYTFATLHSFIGPDGAAPRSGLVFGADGNL